MKIGLEIETNWRHDAPKEWKRKSEHCGYELVSKPAKGPKQIGRLFRSIGGIANSDGMAESFNNAGLHIHIDFRENRFIRASLEKRAAPIKDGQRLNPAGGSKRWYWIDRNTGLFYQSPKDATFENEHLTSLYFSTPRELLNSIQRFMILGRRFARPILFMQHSDRIFNKYCHTIEYVPEEVFHDGYAISEIESHAQGYSRRYMFNVISFLKYGTLEVRCIKATLNKKEILYYTKLFSRMADVAKSGIDIPQPTGNILQDAMMLLGLCKIHGKARTFLLGRLVENTTKPFRVYCYNFHCGLSVPSDLVTDYGNSRGLCPRCVAVARYCNRCGDRIENSKPAKNTLHGLPNYLCGNCDIDEPCTTLIGEYVGREVKDGKLIHLRSLNEVKRTA